MADNAERARAQAIIEHQLASSPSIRSTTVAHGPTWILTVGGVLNIYADLDTVDSVRIAAASRVNQIQFTSSFDVEDETFTALDDHVLAAHPQARWSLSAGQRDQIVHLPQLPRLRSLSASGPDLDLTPVRAHGQIETLGVSGPRTSLRPLAGLESIKNLWWGEKTQDPNVVAELPNLKELTVAGQKLKSLSFLATLPNLESLSFSFGGTTRFDELPGFPALRTISVWRARLLEQEQLHPLNDVKGLRVLSLRELPRLASLDWLVNPAIRTLVLEKIAAGSLAGLPWLEVLVLHSTVSAALLRELTADVTALQVVYVNAMADLDTGEWPFEIRPITFVKGFIPSV